LAKRVWCYATFRHETARPIFMLSENAENGQRERQTAENAENGRQRAKARKERRCKRRMRYGAEAGARGSEAGGRRVGREDAVSRSTTR